jgi:hypothetical protein
MVTGPAFTSYEATAQLLQCTIATVCLMKYKTNTSLGDEILSTNPIDDSWGLNLTQKQ